MANKILVILAVLAVASCILAQSNHFEQGAKLPNDRRLHYEIVQKSSSALQIVTKDVVFPVKGDINYANITYIRAHDQYVNGNGGYASLLKGGVGTTGVTLHFKSQRGHGFNFILEIWGNP